MEGEERGGGRENGLGETDRQRNSRGGCRNALTRIRNTARTLRMYSRGFGISYYIVDKK